MLIIFDVDGTLIGGEPSDWNLFENAIRAVLGTAPDRSYYAAPNEITAQAIAEAAVLAAARRCGTGLEELICGEYLRRLQAAHAEGEGVFRMRSGVDVLLEHLRSEHDIDVALATGDWHPTICFKLEAAGIDFARFPMATSSDRPRRADIIALAAHSSGI